MPRRKDEYGWDKLMANLVKKGFGTYREAANADVVEAVTFLLVMTRETEADRIAKALRGDD